MVVSTQHILRFCCMQALGPEHDDPSSLQCMQAMRATGEANWQAFVHPDVQPLPQGHLMNYPNSVADDGSLKPLPDCEEFPDLVRLLLRLRLLLLLHEAACNRHCMRTPTFALASYAQQHMQAVLKGTNCMSWTPLGNALGVTSCRRVLRALLQGGKILGVKNAVLPGLLTT
jgi:hypothetical protein